MIVNGPPQDRYLIVSGLQGLMMRMARHKFASNVVEKALKYSDPGTRRMLIDELLTPLMDDTSPISHMMKDQYASMFPTCSPNNNMLTVSQTMCCKLACLSLKAIRRKC